MISNNKNKQTNQKLDSRNFEIGINEIWRGKLNSYKKIVLLPTSVRPGHSRVVDEFTIFVVKHLCAKKEEEEEWNSYTTQDICFNFNSDNELVAGRWLWQWQLIGRCRPKTMTAVQ